MATENTETNVGADEEAAPPPEHDYAHNTAANFITTETPSTASGVPVTDGSVPIAPPTNPEMPSLPVGLPGPTVGAEVDCPGGNEEEAASHQQAVDTPAEAPAPSSAAPRGRRRAKRPDDMSCSACKCEFERQGRSFNRRAVYTFTTPDTVHWVFPQTTVNDKSFLCETCAQFIRTKCKRKQCSKRSLWLKPPVKKQPEAKDKKKKARRMGKKSKAALLVSKSCYKAAFKMLWSAKGARKPMLEFWSKQLKEEMKVLTRQVDSPFHQKVLSRKPLTSFPWRYCLNWAQHKAPLVTTCLTSLFPDITALAKSSHQLTEEQAQTLLERRAVVALSIPLFTRNIWKNNFLQAALGAELRLSGCSGSSLDTLNTMGLCQNKDTVRLLLHRLQNGKKTPRQNGRQMLKIKQDQMMKDVVEEEEEEDDEEEDDDDDDDSEEVTLEEEVEEQEVQDRVQMEHDDVIDDDDDVESVEEKLKKRKKKKAKKQKRKERGKRKAGRKEREEEEEDSSDSDDTEESDEDSDEGSENKKRRVVVVRLGLLKGHSEVGRSDLSAP